MSESGEPGYCLICKGPATRIFTIPHMAVIPTPSDILNSQAAGWGDPVPGWSREKTKFYANTLAADQKKNKGQKPSSHPSISTASSPVATPYYGTGN